jgi:hypothetical protein
MLCKVCTQSTLCCGGYWLIPKWFSSWKYLIKILLGLSFHSVTFCVAMYCYYTFPTPSAIAGSEPSFLLQRGIQCPLSVSGVLITQLKTAESGRNNFRYQILQVITVRSLHPTQVTDSSFADMTWGETQSRAGLPDFFCYNIPKWGKIYHMITKYTKWS